METFSGIIQLNLDGMLNYENYLRHYKRIAVPRDCVERLQSLAKILLANEPSLSTYDREHLQKIAAGNLPEPFYILEEKCAKNARDLDT